MTKLTTLNLGENGIGEAGAAAVQCGSLAAMNLEGNLVGDAGATALATSPYLRHLVTLTL
jgi:hypothetical protein